MKDAQNFGDLRGRTFPIGGRQCEQGEGVNAQTRRGFNYGARGLGTGAVASRAGEAAGSGPAAVAVGDDGDVDGARKRNNGLEIGLDYRNGLLGKDR